MAGFGNEARFTDALHGQAVRRNGNTGHITLAFVFAAITDDTPDPLRLCLQRQHPYGSDRFRTAIDAQLDRRCGPAKISRPKKQRPE